MRTSQKTPETITTIGIDLGKNTFHLVGLDKRGAIVLQQKVSRSQLGRRLANIPRCLIGMEAHRVHAYSEPLMKARYFHHQPRRGVTAIGPIAHAVEDDDQIETWMIGQGQEQSGNRQIVVRRAWKPC